MKPPSDEVAAANPAATRFFGSGIGIFVIFGERPSPLGTVDEFADFIRRQRLVVLIHDLYIKRRPRLTHGPYFAYFLGIGIDHEAAFGLRVELDNLGVKTLLELFPDRTWRGSA